MCLLDLPTLHQNRCQINDTSSEWRVLVAHSMIREADIILKPLLEKYGASSILEFFSIILNEDHSFAREWEESTTPNKGYYFERFVSHYRCCTYMCADL